MRLGSFSEAARELAVSPAAVSLRIRNLEADLGICLFERRGPRVFASDAALRLAGSVAKALSQIDAAVSGSIARAGHLRVTCVPSLGARWLAPRLHKYHRRKDAVPLDLDITREIRDPGSFDIAIRSGDGNFPGFQSTLLFPLTSTPMLSPRLAGRIAIKEPADLARLPLLAHPLWPAWFDEAGVSGIVPDYYPDAYPTHDLDATAAVESVGVALLPTIIFSSLLAEGRLIQPFRFVVGGNTGNYLLRDAGENRPSVAGFVEWIASELKSARKQLSRLSRQAE